MTQEPKDKTLENTIVRLSTLVISTGVGMVVRKVVKHATGDLVSTNKTTAILMVVGEIAISGLISDAASKKYERNIRSFFRNLEKDQSKEGEKVDGKKEFTTNNNNR